ncbi:MAG: redoxin domain-containing protein [Fuerstiella sp.]
MLTAAACGVLLTSTASAAAEPVAEFSGKTFRGQPWALEEQDNKLVVLAFLGTECPLAKLYGPRLQQIQDQFGDDVAIVGVNSNRQDSITEISAWVARHNIRYPVLKDAGNRIADLLHAERTPEVVVLDADRIERYRGRIDDQYLVGRTRYEVQRRDLVIAIEELLAGKSVSVSKTEPIGCHIGRIKNTTPQGEITYSNQIARIFNRRCVECHREGQIAPFTLTDYDSVIGWEDTILEVIADNRMPPWFADPKHGSFRNDARLSDDEKQLIRTWVQNGMPEGDRSQLPDPPQFATGWRMEEPDETIYVRDQPFDVPAQGVVDYQYFVQDPGWTEDKFICAAEARPDNVGVVHHILAYIIPPGEDPAKAKSRRVIVGYAPGSPPQILKDGTAIHVKAGSKILFEMHYTPNGTAQQDRSYIGVKFLERDQVKKLLRGRMAIDTKFRIPANSSDHVVTADTTLRRDELLLEMSPHMHLRGKSFRYEAFYPDGSHEVLLDVPNYDFNWQLAYELDKPKLLPKGTRIFCRAVFDNSADNPVNPNPNQPVRWGDQSDEEMMIGFFNTVDASAQDKARAKGKAKDLSDASE